MKAKTINSISDGDQYHPCRASFLLFRIGLNNQQSIPIEMTCLSCTTYQVVVLISFQKWKWIQQRHFFREETSQAIPNDAFRPVQLIKLAHVRETQFLELEVEGATRRLTEVKEKLEGQQEMGRLVKALPSVVVVLS